jgi:hypothetical protein
MPYQFIHIGKTGGTLIREVLRSLPEEHRLRFRFHSHDVTLPQALETRPEMPVFFSVRRPEALFVSGFNSRRRQGGPTYDQPWNPRERVAFSLFRTPNELAEALSAADPHVRACAEFSMLTINHVRKGLRWYLHGIPILERHRDQIAAVLLQENLEPDLRAFAERIGVPLEAAAIRPTERLHAAMAEDEQELSATGLANVRQWYRPDREIYDWCVAFHDRAVAGQTAT